MKSYTDMVACPVCCVAVSGPHPGGRGTGGGNRGAAEGDRRVEAAGEGRSSAQGFEIAILPDILK